MLQLVGLLTGWVCPGGGSLYLVTVFRLSTATVVLCAQLRGEGCGWLSVGLHIHRSVLVRCIGGLLVSAASYLTACPSPSPSPSRSPTLSPLLQWYYCRVPRYAAVPKLPAVLPQRTFLDVSLWQGLSSRTTGQDRSVCPSHGGYWVVCVNCFCDF